MSKTRNERRLRRSRAIGSAVFTVCILLALFADSWVEIILCPPPNCQALADMARKKGRRCCEHRTAQRKMIQFHSRTRKEKSQ